MEEINAWGAYEAGTTQNARSLGRSTVRQRRAPAAAAPEADEGDRQPLAKLKQNRRSTHALFFGTDDIAALKKADEEVADKEKGKEDDDAVTSPSNTTKEEDAEQDSIRNLARDVFRVYFSTDDSHADKSKLKKIQERGIHTKINGTMPYLTAYLTKLQLPGPIVYTLLFIEASLRGMAQVYFQNNPVSGLFILSGMFVQSSRVAVHGILAVVAGNLAGVLMGFDKSFLSCGLFGYNSFLVGLALATFYSPEKHGDYYWPVVIGSIIFAYFSSVLFVMLGKILSPYKTPPFTLPFNLATILFLLAMGGMNNVAMAPVRQPDLPSYETQPITSLTAKAFFAGSIRGVGQVFLANDLVASVLVLVGIMVCSRIASLAAFFGSAIGAGVAAWVGCPRDAIENGMYGFNPSLTLTAMLMFYVPSFGSISIGIIASMITVFIQLAMATALEPIGLPFLTLPFCFAALAFIVIQGTTSTVISVPLSSMTTPEDHLKRVSRLLRGFDLLYGAIRSSSYKGSHERKTIFNRGSSAMSSVLEQYEEGLNDGGDKAGCFDWCCLGKGSGGNTHHLERARSSISMSWAMTNPSFGNEEKDNYALMFRSMDMGNKYEIDQSQFRQYLESIGLDDPVGLDFACQAFQLMDLDRSGDIDLDEFIAFCQISRHMPEIRHLVVTFFRFADINGDHSVEINELDQARSYLGLPPLSDKDHSSLEALYNDDDELEFDVIVNFVTIFKLKSIVKDFQANRKLGFSLDQSLNSSFRVAARSSTGKTSKFQAALSSSFHSKS